MEFLGSVSINTVIQDHIKNNGCVLKAISFPVMGSGGKCESESICVTSEGYLIHFNHGKGIKRTFNVGDFPSEPFYVNLNRFRDKTGDHYVSMIIILDKDSNVLVLKEEDGKYERFSSKEKVVSSDLLRDENGNQLKIRLRNGDTFFVPAFSNQTCDRGVKMESKIMDNLNTQRGRILEAYKEAYKEKLEFQKLMEKSEFSIAELAKNIIDLEQTVLPRKEVKIEEISGQIMQSDQDLIVTYKLKNISEISILIDSWDIIYGFFQNGSPIIRSFQSTKRLNLKSSGIAETTDLNMVVEKLLGEEPETDEASVVRQGDKFSIIARLKDVDLVGLNIELKSKLVIGKEIEITLNPIKLRTMIKDRLNFKDRILALIVTLESKQTLQLATFFRKLEDFDEILNKAGFSSFLPEVFVNEEKKLVVERRGGLKFCVLAENDFAIKKFIVSLYEILDEDVEITVSGRTDFSEDYSISEYLRELLASELRVLNQMSSKVLKNCKPATEEDGENFMKAKRRRLESLLAEEKVSLKITQDYISLRRRLVATETKTDRAFN